MALRRYARTPRIGGGLQLATPQAVAAIRQGIKNGSIKTRTQVMTQVERLDILAGAIYGDARLWWIIAAASNIGWGLQVPPGITIAIPEDLGQIGSLVS